MSRRLAYLLVSLLLCQCAAKHQPIEFAPYFPMRPDGQFDSSQLDERTRLESKISLSPFDKKRLRDLYLLELRRLKPGGERYAALSISADRLRSDVEGMERDVAELQAQSSKFRAALSQSESGKIAWTNHALKRLYLEANKLWNKDQTDLALKKVSDIAANPEWKAKATRPEWLRVLRLQFRVALDAPDLPRAQQAFQEMVAADSCSPETTEVGFLLALSYFAAGDAKQAETIFDEQCDPDHSPANQVRRKYWQARFREQVDPSTSNKLYAEVLSSRMPGYYVYLADSHLGKKIEVVDESARAKEYLSKEFRITHAVHELLLEAEVRLKANLRKDAEAYLLKGAYLLKEDLTTDSIFPLLYIAHLFQATGDHLEAMKIYSVVTSLFMEDSPAVAPLKVDFLPEMFPRPYNSTVESLSREWGADPDFIYAIMRQESAFNPGAVSVVDARGLMQLMPSLARSLSHQWSYQPYYSDRLLFDADENLKLSTFHLSQLRALAPHVVLMSAAYNAGMSRVSGWWKRFGALPLDVFVEFIPVNETRNYVKLVMRNYIYYKALRSGGVVDSTLIPFQLPPFQRNTPGFALRATPGSPDDGLARRSPNGAKTGDLLRHFALRK